MLQQPIAPLLARQSEKVGFSQLAKLGGAAPPNPAPDGEASEGGTTAEAGAPKGLPISVEEPVQTEAAGPSVQQQWSAFCAAQLTLLREGPAQEAAAQGTTGTACWGPSELPSPQEVSTELWTRKRLFLWNVLEAVLQSEPVGHCLDQPPPAGVWF